MRWKYQPDKSVLLFVEVDMSPTNGPLLGRYGVPYFVVELELELGHRCRTPASSFDWTTTRSVGLHPQQTTCFVVLQPK